jgi:predicted O-methyltransferase YrrM
VPVANLQTGFSALERELDAEFAALETSRNTLYAEFTQLQRHCEESQGQLLAVIRHRDELHSELTELKRNLPWAPPGHFYSPIPSLDEVRKDEERIFGSVQRGIAGIEMREAEQLALLHELVPYYREMPFRPERREGLRYYFDNPTYSPDAILLHGMIRHLRPRRIIEIGSGFSSCLMLDTNDLFFGGAIGITFIEPHPDVLMSVIRDSDRMSVRRIENRLQDVGLEEFQSLQENDILFVDSTHVSKIGSDVNRVFFDILPTLRRGVHIHFHDIFFPFEYPKTWIDEGRAWNEAYLLRVFLQHNDAFRIVLMNDFLSRFHEAFFRQEMPLCLRNSGASIWLRRE